MQPQKQMNPQELKFKRAKNSIKSQNAKNRIHNEKTYISTTSTGTGRVEAYIQKKQILSYRPFSRKLTIGIKLIHDK